MKIFAMLNMRIRKFSLSLCIEALTCYSSYFENITQSVKQQISTHKLKIFDMLSDSRPSNNNLSHLLRFHEW